jgi:hypothetical protein
MSEHEIKRGWRDRLKSMIPFGLGRTKPKHFRDLEQTLAEFRPGSETRVQ